MWANHSDKLNELILKAPHRKDVRNIHGVINSKIGATSAATGVRSVEKRFGQVTTVRVIS